MIESVQVLRGKGVGMTDKWRLCQYEITESDDNPGEFSWTKRWLDEHKRIMVVSGHARIAKGVIYEKGIERRVLVMEPSEEPGNLDEEFTNMTELEQHLNRLATWKRTDYFAEREDFDSSVYFDCEMGRCITPIGDVVWTW